VSNTGWTWQHVRLECDLPTYFALCDLWHEVPPPAVQLRRIAQFLGLQAGADPATPRMAATTALATPATPSSQQDIAMAASMAGMRAIDGRPADPMLDLID
jgi:hypothetical protein